MVLKNVVCILPVNGGVVLCGTAPDGAQRCHVAAHYDLTTRIVRTLYFGLDALDDWATFPELHCVVTRRKLDSIAAIDFATPLDYTSFFDSTRSTEAMLRSWHSRAGPKPLVIETGTWKMRDELVSTLNLKDNSFRLIAPPAEPWTVLTPNEDGKPLLAGAMVSQAQLAGEVLAMAITKGHVTELRLYRGPDPTALGVVPLHGNPKLFPLSHDGRKLAWLRSKREVALAGTDRLPHVIEKFTHAALHGQFAADCEVGPFQLEIRVGSYQHRIGIGQEGLWHGFTNQKNARPTLRTPQSDALPSLYDSTRFQVLAGTPESTYRVIFDRFGQLLLLNSADDVLVVFLVRRDKIAAWTPAGGFWGSPDLIGGAPTPGADKAIALAIRPDWRSP